MADTARKKAGPLYGRCPRCSKEGVRLACGNCRRSEGLKLSKGVATCECGHQMESHPCPCGAVIYPASFARDPERERQDRERGVPDRIDPPADSSPTYVSGALAGYHWLKKAHGHWKFT